MTLPRCSLHENRVLKGDLFQYPLYKVVATDAIMTHMHSSFHQRCGLTGQLDTALTIALSRRKSPAPQATEAQPVDGLLQQNLALRRERRRSTLVETTTMQVSASMHASQHDARLL